MKVSIALASYNGEAHIADQLQSFLDQSRPPDELVVSDGMSADRTCAIVEDFAERAPFSVRLIRNSKRLGVAQSFDRALAMSTGELVFLSDQDDVWSGAKIATVLGWQERYPDKLLFMNDAEIADGDLGRTGLTKLGQLRAAGYSNAAFVMGCCCAARRDLLDLCLPIPAAARGHDNWIVDWANGLGAALVCDEVLQLYRRHGGNASNVLPNSTRRITRWQRARYQLRRATSSDANIMALDEMAHVEALSLAARRGTGRLDGRYDAAIADLAVQLEEDLAVLRHRHALRAKPLPWRLMGSLQYWFDGGYRTGGGFKSLLRDVIG